MPRCQATIPARFHRARMEAGIRLSRRYHPSSYRHALDTVDLGADSHKQLQWLFQICHTALEFVSQPILSLPPASTPASGTRALDNVGGQLRGE